MKLMNLLSHRGRQAQEFFDWMIVRHASEKLQDDDATLAMALCRLLNHELERLQVELNHYQNPGQYPDQIATPVIATPAQSRDHCKLLLSRIDNLKDQRNKLLYKDYRVREKKVIIYQKSLQLTID